MASAMILARLLSPEEFGLVAMATVFSPLLRLFREGGLSTATVQQHQITQAQVSNLFWINTALGAAVALLCAALAPAVAWYFRDPRLISITFVLGVTFLFSGASVQNLAVLNRQMKFWALALVDIGALIASLVVGVTMAFSGYGYWSLVGSQVANSVTELVLAFFASRWRPHWPKAHTGTRALVNFGACLTASTLLRRLAQGTDTLFIGRFYGVDAIGLYSRALFLLARPMDTFIAPFDAVFIPLLSRLQNDPERYRRTFLKAYNAIALLSFPMAALLLGLSHPLVLIPAWPTVGGSNADIRLVYLGRVIHSLCYAAMWLPVTQGRNSDILVAGVALSIITIFSVIAGLPLGPVGVALSFSACGLLIRLPIQFYIVGRSGPVSALDLWSVFFRHLVTYGVVLGATYLVEMIFTTSSPVTQVSVGGPIGLAAGVATILLVPSHRRLALDLFKAFRHFAQRKDERGASEEPRILEAS